MVVDQEGPVILTRSGWHARADLGDLMLPNSWDLKRFKYRQPSDYKGESCIDLNKFLEQCEIVFEVESTYYATDRAKILLARQYLSGPPHDDWNRTVKRLVNPTWKEFQRVLSESLGDPAMERQEAYDHYMKLCQQKGQSAIEYLKQLKEQLPRLDDEARRPESLLMKFKLGLLSSNKDRLALLPPKMNYNVDEQAAWVTRNERTNLGLVNLPYQGSHQATVTKETPTTAQSSTPASSLKPNPVTSSSTNRVRVPDAEMQRRRTERLCLKCGASNHLMAACLKGWTATSPNPNASPATSPNHEQLGSRAGKGTTQ